jgi:copper(I)-binding protein
MLIALAALAVSTAVLAGCGGSDEVEVSDAWARTSPMLQKAGAIYMTIESDQADRLTAASVPSSVAARTELHETTMAKMGATGATGATGDMADSNGADEESGGMKSEDGESMPHGGMTGASGESMAGAMTMKPVDGIDLPAGEPVQLKPGGYHVMLLDLAQPLEAGQQIEVTLTFEKAGKQTVTAEVRAQ